MNGSLCLCGILFLFAALSAGTIAQDSTIPDESEARTTRVSLVEACDLGPQVRQVLECVSH